MLQVLALVQRRGGVVVEVLERPGRWQASEAEPPGEATRLGRADLEVEQPFQGRGRAELVSALAPLQLGQLAN